MMIIEIYRHCGTWAFTDDSRELVHEPFVAGIPEIIDHLIDIYSDSSKDRHKITFSSTNFPGSQARLTRKSAEHGGYWYQFGPNMEGWLCPATLKYFPEHPEELFVRFD